MTPPPPPPHSLSNSAGLPWGKQTHSEASKTLSTHKCITFTCTFTHVYIREAAQWYQWGSKQSEICVWTENTCETEPANRIKVVTECSCFLTVGRRAALPDHVWVLFALDGSTMSHLLEDGNTKKWLLPGVKPPAGRQPVRLMIWLPFLFFFYIPPIILFVFSNFAYIWQYASTNVWCFVLCHKDDIVKVWAENSLEVEKPKGRKMNYWWTTMTNKWNIN